MNNFDEFDQMGRPEDGSTQSMVPDNHLGNELIPKDLEQVTPERGLPRQVPDSPSGPRMPSDTASRDAAAMELFRKSRSVALENALRKEQKAVHTGKEIEHLLHEEREQKLNGVMARFGDKYNKQGFKIINNSNAINLTSYAGNPLYSKDVIDGDLAYIEKRKNNFAGESIGGKKIENLTLALINKSLPDAICVKASEFDDIYNGIDIVLAINGSIVGVFDTFFKDDSKEDVRGSEKKGIIDLKNKAGGARLKYGFEIRNKEISLCPETGIPSFVLGVNSGTMDKAADAFEMPIIDAEGKIKSPIELNNFEKGAAYSLLYSTYQQIDKIESQIKNREIKLDDSRYIGDIGYKKRLEMLKSYLESKIPRAEVEKYFKDQAEKAKTGSTDLKKGKSTKPRKKKAKLSDWFPAA